MDKPQQVSRSPCLTRDQIEEARAYLKTYYPNHSADRHTFNRICDQAVIAARSETGQTETFTISGTDGEIAAKLNALGKCIPQSGDKNDELVMRLRQEIGLMRSRVVNETVREILAIPAALMEQAAEHLARSAIRLSKEERQLIGTAEIHLRTWATSGNKEPYANTLDVANRLDDFLRATDSETRK